MINFFKKLFGFGKKAEETKTQPPKPKSSDHAMDHDMIDYDGMGNQGRFPMH